MPILQGKFRTAGLVLLGASLAVAPAFSQQDAPPPPAAQGDMQGPPRGGGRMNPEKRLEMMTKALNLTTDQQASIKQIMADQRTKMEAQRSQAQSMSQDDRRAAMMSMMADEKTKIEAVLTPDQKTKFEAMEAKMHERMEHRGGGGGGNPPPPPAQ